MVGGARDLDNRESRSTRAFEELMVEGRVDWEREKKEEEERGAPLEEEAELHAAEMGGASGVDDGCRQDTHCICTNKYTCTVYM